MANSSATAADIAAPLREAQAAKAGTRGGDEEFRRLFASWNGTSVASVPSRPRTVSIPSRMPLEGAALTSGFGMRTHPVLGGRRGHKGIDLSSPIGTPIYATADAVVTRADWFSSYGLFISLDHGAQLETRYGHLSRLNVAEGQVVKKGDLIGYVGSTGRSTGPHLHYEVRIAGTAVNPVPYMQGDAWTGTLAAKDGDGETAKGGSK
ncbi:M23 family metallopeptidase [Novosphingobium ginsenosidimutans]|uniref:M23 family metallopeptidase n=1 Tax=Novosphingobium ginsenosidimutans TaxID=1176536 RepID=A0A5B8S9Z5_9SPHN|nr:M23 family metallopeptidase [Novosphingobium ginsenosidimutans]